MFLLTDRLLNKILFFQPPIPHCFLVSGLTPHKIEGTVGKDHSHLMVGEGRTRGRQHTMVLGAAARAQSGVKGVQVREGSQAAALKITQGKQRERGLPLSDKAKYLSERFHSQLSFYFDLGWLWWCNMLLRGISSTQKFVGAIGRALCQMFMGGRWVKKEKDPRI